MPLYRGTRGLVLLRRVVAAPAFSLTNTAINKSESPGTSSVTFSAQSLGATSANRRIIVVAWLRITDTSNTTVSVGSVPATLIASSSSIQANITQIGIYETTSDPVGSTGDVIITGNTTIARCVFAVYRLVTTTPTATASDANFNASIGTAFGIAGTSIIVPASGGGIFAIATRSDVTDSTLSANLTKDNGLFMVAGGDLTVGHFNANGSQTPTGTPGSVDEVHCTSAVWQA